MIITQKIRKKLGSMQKRSPQTSHMFSL